MASHGEKDRFRVLHLSDALPNGCGAVFVVHDSRRPAVICGRRTLQTSQEFNWDVAEGVELSSAGDHASASEILAECNSIAVNQSGLVYTIVASCDEGRVYCIWDATLGHFLGRVYGHTQLVHSERVVFGATDVIACGRFIFAQSHTWNDSNTSTDCTDYTLALGICTQDQQDPPDTAVWHRVFDTENGAQQGACCDHVHDRVLFYSKTSLAVVIVHQCSAIHLAASKNIDVRLASDVNAHDIKDVTHATLDCGNICTAVNCITALPTVIFYIWAAGSARKGVVTPSRMYQKAFANPSADTDHIKNVYNIRCTAASVGIWVSYIIEMETEADPSVFWDTPQAACMLMLINTDFDRTYTRCASGDTNNWLMVRSVDGESVYLNSRVYTCSPASRIKNWLL